MDDLNMAFRARAQRVAAVCWVVCLAAFALPAAGEAAASEEAAGPLEEIVVRGIRGSMRQSVEMKRAADNIVDALVAEDIGKFPDQNLAESLQRVSGVAIDRQRGEGALVSIRGLGPQFVRVQMNGRTAMSTGIGAAGSFGVPQNSRTFYFDSMQSELVQAVEVYKTPQADLVEGGLGGTVNIRTRRPFDVGGERVLAGSALATYNELRDSTDYRVSGAYSDTFADDTLGFLIGIAYDDRTVREDWMGHPDYEPKIFNRAVDENGNALQPCTLIAAPEGAGCGYTPGNIRLGLVLDERQRLNISSALQWRPRPDLDVNIDMLYSTFDREYIDLQVPLRSQAGLANRATEVHMNQNDVVTYFHTTGARPRPFPYNHDTTTDQRQLGANLVFSPSERLHFNFDLAYAMAEVDQVQQSTYYDIAGGVPVTWDIRNSFIPKLSLDADLNDPSIYTFALLWRALRVSEDNELQFRSDVTYEFDDGSYVKAGISYRDREREYSQYSFTAGTRHGVFLNEPLANVKWHEFPVDDYLDGIDGAGSWPSGWVWPDPDDVFQTYFVDRRGEIPESLFQSASDSRSEDFFINEKTTALYLMGHLAGTLGDIPFSGNAGVRVVQVDRASTGNVQPIQDIVYSEASGVYSFVLLPAEFQTHDNDYTYWLPSVNLKFELREDLLLRGAWGKTMAQPNFDDLNPGGFKLASTRRVQEGNPYLEPHVAEQLDISLEWYLSDSSIAAIAGFGKWVESFITTVTTLEDFIHPDTGRPIEDVESGGNVRLQYQGPRNEDGAFIGGVELMFQHVFANLPSPFDGIGVQANYTRVTTDAEFTNPNSGATFDVPGLSKNTYNVVLFYEKGPVSGRVAWNQRDSFLVSVSDTRSNPRFTRKYSQIDAGFSYNVSERISVVFEGINLGDDNVIQYNIVGPVSTLEQLRYTSNTGRRFQAGVRISL